MNLGGAVADSLLSDSGFTSEAAQKFWESPEKVQAFKEGAVKLAQSVERGEISSLGNVQSIIAEKVDENTIKLRVLSVNYDQTIEEMVRKSGFNNNSNITSTNFSKSKNGRNDVEEVELFLFRPVPAGQVYSTKNVEKAINKAGFISVDLPELSPIKEHCDELWDAGVKFITALGKSSRWRNPDGYVYTPYLDLSPDDRRFNLYWVEVDWSDDVWFVVRRK